MAPVGVIEAPRVQLENGLFRTSEKTDLGADGFAIIIGNITDGPVSCRVGRLRAGGELESSFADRTIPASVRPLAVEA